MRLLQTGRAANFVGLSIWKKVPNRCSDSHLHAWDDAVGNKCHFTSTSSRALCSPIGETQDWTLQLRREKTGSIFMSVYGILMIVRFYWRPAEYFVVSLSCHFPRILWVKGHQVRIPANKAPTVTQRDGN